MLRCIAMYIDVNILPIAGCLPLRFQMVWSHAENRSSRRAQQSKFTHSCFMCGSDNQRKPGEKLLSEWTQHTVHLLLVLLACRGNLKFEAIDDVLLLHWFDFQKRNAADDDALLLSPSNATGSTDFDWFAHTDRLTYIYVHGMPKHTHHIRMHGGHKHRSSDAEI